MGYKQTLENNIKRDNDHPMNCGIPMQVHHLISQSVINKDDLKPKLKKFKYKVNTINNLVALPSTLAGACHLEAQLHRGNHTTPICPNEMDNDKYHKRPYHSYVAEVLIKKLKKIEDRCALGKQLKPHIKLNTVSKIILRGIISFRLPLSSCYKEFKSGNNGCADCESIPALNDKKSENTMCSKHRVHTEFSKSPKRPYRLKIGR